MYSSEYELICLFVIYKSTDGVNMVIMVMTIIHCINDIKNYIIINSEYLLSIYALCRD